MKSLIGITKPIIIPELENDVVDENDVAPTTNKSSLSDYLFNGSTKKHGRYKRQADQYEYTPTKTRCPLLLVADYRFFQEMGSGNTKTTINYLVSFFTGLFFFCYDIQLKSYKYVKGYPKCL